MLKNITLRKIALATMLLFICFLFVLFPNNEDSIKLDGKESIDVGTACIKTISGNSCSE